MEIILTRMLLFTVLPVLLGMGVLRRHKSATSPACRAEAMLIPLLIVGVAGSGLGGFVAHVFISDQVADVIGWDRGSPFQAEVGFANLAIGLLGAIAAGRRDGFREATVLAATVLAATVFGVGASIVHLVDIVDTGNPHRRATQPKTSRTS